MARYADVVFPQKVGILTYEVPEGMQAPPGALVEAELRQSIRRGIVLREAAGPPKRGGVKPIAGIVEPAALGPAMLRLLAWMADYYMLSHGLVLKSMLPEEFFHGSAERKAHLLPAPVELPSGHPPESDAFIEKIQKGRGQYAAYLLHAPSTEYELVFALDAAEGCGPAIVLAPDNESAEQAAAAFAARYGEGRVILYHGGMSHGARTTSLRRMPSGDCIVVGSQSAIFAPITRAGLIVVLGEESTLYKSGQGPRHSARDVAVMRAYLEGCPVVLSSVCPSLESWHNASLGKYTLINATASHQWPRVRVIGSGGAMSEPLRVAIRQAMSHGGRGVLYHNRRGYSLFACPECGHSEACPHCHVPLVYHKTPAPRLECGLCGLEKTPPSTCPGCRGIMIGPSGSGLELAAEELAGLYEEIGPQRLDEQDAISMGARGLVRSRSESGLALAAVLNADAYAHAPDFRARERAMQDFVYLASKLSATGTLILQSRNPRDPLFSVLRKFDFKRFYESELAFRREAGYPPATRMAAIEVRAQKEPPHLTSAIDGASIIGPVGFVPRGSRGKRMLWKYLIRASSRETLHRAATDALKALKAHQCTIEMDPA